MQDKTLFRVVQPPEDEHLKELIEAVITPEVEALDISAKTAIKFTVAKKLHRFGVHLFVPWRVYDERSGRIIRTGRVG